MLKCKMLMARNSSALEREFNEWCNLESMFDAKLRTDRNGNLVMAVFWQEAEVDEPELPVIAEDVAAEEQEQDEAKLVRDVQDITEYLCPHCGCLTKPGHVERGPYAGRLKCTECKKTFTEEQAESEEKLQTSEGMNNE